MLQISTQFPARLQQQDGEKGLVTVRMQLNLNNPFVIEVLILQESGPFGWQLATEALTETIKRPGKRRSLGSIQIKSKESRRFVHITLPAGERSFVKLRCPWSEVDQFVRLVEQVVRINDLLPQYLETGYRAFEELLRKQ